jgi:hypothetical protein
MLLENISEIAKPWRARPSHSETGVDLHERTVTQSVTRRGCVRMEHRL